MKVQKKDKRTCRTIVSFLVIFLLGKPLMQIFTMVLGGRFFPEPQMSHWTDLIFLASFFIFILALWIVVKIIEKSFFSTLHLEWNKQSLKILGKYFFLGMFLVFLILNFMVLFGLYNFRGFHSIHLPYVFFGLLAYFIQACAEELLIRGYLHHRIMESYGYKWGLIVNTFFFTLPHLLSFNNFFDIQAVISIINLIFISITFTQVMTLSSSLWSAIGLHLGWNYCLGIVFGVAVSGFSGKMGVFQFESIGSNISLTGGEYGIEASIILVPILLLLNLFLRQRIRRKDENKDGIFQ